MNPRLFLPIGAALAGMILGAISSYSYSGVRAEVDIPSSSAPDSNKALSHSSTQDTQPDALGEVLSTLGGKADLRQLARMGEALARLTPAQMAALMDRVETDDSQEARDRIAGLFKWWYQRDPAQANAWIQKRLDLAVQDGPLGPTFHISSQHLLCETWAKANPEGAFEFAKRHPRSGLAPYLLGYAIKAWPEQSGKQKTALLLGFPPGKTRENVLSSVLRSWAKDEPDAALATAQSLTEPSERMKALAEVLKGWTSKDPETAFAKYQTLGISDVKLATSLLTSLAETNPLRAVELLGNLDPAHHAETAQSIVEKWASKDPAAALMWALENGVNLAGRQEITQRVRHASFGRTTVSSFGSIDPIGTAMRNKSEAVLAWLRSLPPGANRDQIAEQVMLRGMNADQMLTLFSQLSPDAAARVAHVVASTLAKDPERAQQWVATLPSGPVRERAWIGFGSDPYQKIPLPAAGPERDAMLSGRVFPARLQLSPIPSLETAMQISDPLLRRDVLDTAMDDFTSSRRASKEWGIQALEWLEKSEVPEEWKKRWRAQVRDE